jgi:hypothetical protein
MGRMGILGANSRKVAEVGSTASQPLHVVNRIIPEGAGGHFKMCSASGILAAALAAGAQLFYMRWTSASQLLVLTRLRVQFQTLTAFTAGTLTDFGFDLFKATAVSAGGGGTSLTSPKSKMRSSYAASLLDVAGMARIATTGGLTALTTLDAYPIAQSIGKPQRANPAAATEEPTANLPTLLFQADIGSGEAPIILAANEGIVVANRAVWPAAGTGIISVEASWAELDAY